MMFLGPMPLRLENSMHREVYMPMQSGMIGAR